MSWKGVITNAGQTLLDQWTLGGHMLTITGATVGSGYVADAGMRAATALSSEKDDASIISSEAISDGTRFKIQVGPTDGTAYTAHEVGLWAKLDDGDEVLLALHEDSDIGVAVPTRTESPDFAFAIYLVHSISNSGDLSVDIDTSAYVTQSTFAAEAAKQESRHLRFVDTTTPDPGSYDPDRNATFNNTLVRLFCQFVVAKAPGMLLSGTEDYDSCVVEFETMYGDRLTGTCAIKLSVTSATQWHAEVKWALSTGDPTSHVLLAFHGNFRCDYNPTTHATANAYIYFNRLVEQDERSGSFSSIGSNYTITNSSIKRSGKVCMIDAVISLASAQASQLELNVASISGIGTNDSMQDAHGFFIGSPSNDVGLVRIDSGRLKIVHNYSGDTIFHVLLQYLAKD